MPPARSRAADPPSRAPHSGWRFHLAIAVAIATACRPAQAPPPTPAAVACALDAGIALPPARGDTIVVAVLGPIDLAAAPVARSEGERVLFGQLYQSLIELGCDGAVRPGLARAWHATDGGRIWVFTLRSGVRFWDGVPVTAADVRASWLSRDSGAAAPAPWAGAAADAVTAVDDTTLEVRLETAAAAVPRAIADPRLAVVKRVPGLAAPLGTGRYWLDATAELPTAAPVASQSGPVLAFTAATGDPRDALDAGADAVLTDDPATVAYAAARADLASIPLPWDRSYVLVGAWLTDSAPDGAALARDAVPVEARAAALPDWWIAASECEIAAAPVPPAPAVGGPIAYPRDDPVARALAERLVVIAGDTARALGYGPTELEAVLRRGGAVAAVVSIPRMVFDPCVARRAVRALSQSLPDGVVPLVDVRRRLIVRFAPSGVYVGWDGVPRWR